MNRSKRYFILFGGEIEIIHKNRSMQEYLVIIIPKERIFSPSTEFAQ